MSLEFYNNYYNSYFNVEKGIAFRINNTNGDEIILDIACENENLILPKYSSLLLLKDSKIKYIQLSEPELIELYKIQQERMDKINFIKHQKDATFKVISYLLLGLEKQQLLYLSTDNIAKVFNLSRETVTRILIKLREKRLIGYPKNRSNLNYPISILKPLALQNYLQ